MLILRLLDPQHHHLLLLQQHPPHPEVLLWPLLCHTGRVERPVDGDNTIDTKSGQVDMTCHHNDHMRYTTIHRLDFVTQLSLLSFYCVTKRIHVVTSTDLGLILLLILVWVMC